MDNDPDTVTPTKMNTFISYSSRLSSLCGHHCLPLRLVMTVALQPSVSCVFLYHEVCELLYAVDQIEPAQHEYLGQR